MVYVTHRLEILRKQYGLTRQELSVLSGICPDVIGRIESENNPFKVHEESARALAVTLCVSVTDLFDDTELSTSGRGRPPHTGKPIEGKESPGSTLETLCPHCFILVPTLVGCEDCGWQVAA